VDIDGNPFSPVEKVHLRPVGRPGERISQIFNKSAVILSPSPDPTEAKKQRKLEGWM